MRFRSSFHIGLSIIVALQVLTAAVAIALISRMSPAIEQILAENMTSVEAANSILAVLLEAERPSTAEQRVRYLAATEMARANITLDSEYAIVGELERLSAAALDGEPEARTAAARAAMRLSAVNQEAMRRADDEASRIGAAGAWAAGLLALLTFAISLVIMRRLQVRLLEPLAELYDVIQATRQGDPFRRCHVPGVDQDMRQVFQGVNELIDQVQRKRPFGVPPPAEPASIAPVIHLHTDSSEIR